MTTISVIVPTIEGREDHFERFKESYARTLADDGIKLDLCVGYGLETCGLGWHVAAQEAQGDYLHFTCDDIEPQPGWGPAGINALGRKIIPAPRMVNAGTGNLESFPQWGAEHADGTYAGMSCLPMITREMWETVVPPLLTCHYFTDNWISYRAAMAGYDAKVINAYGFKHHWADHMRGAGMEYGQRLQHDQNLFYQAANMVALGLWTEPWPLKPPAPDFSARTEEIRAAGFELEAKARERYARENGLD